MLLLLQILFSQLLLYFEYVFLIFSINMQIFMFLNKQAKINNCGTGVIIQALE